MMTPRSDSPMYPPQMGSPTPFPAAPTPPRTSGLAIASLVLGCTGLVACCVAVPSLLAIVFGVAALPAINRGESRGRGLAIGGLVLGIIGLLLGAGGWTLITVSPPNTPVAGSQLSTRQRDTLLKMGVVEKGEEIELFYPDGLFSIKEGGAVITARRLVLYVRNAKPQKAALSEVSAIDFTPAASWLDDGQFVVTLDNGELLTFTVNGQDCSDKLFHKVLEQKVKAARGSAGRNVENSETTGDADSSDALKPASRPNVATRPASDR